LKKRLFLLSVAIAVMLFLCVKGYCQERKGNAFQDFQLKLEQDLQEGIHVSQYFLTLTRSSGTFVVLPRHELEKIWSNLVSEEINRITGQDLELFFSELEGDTSSTDKKWSLFNRKKGRTSHLKEQKSRLLKDLHSRLEQITEEINLPNRWILKMYLSSLNLDSLTLSTIPSMFIQSPNSVLANWIYPQVMQLYYLPRLESAYEDAVKVFLYGSRNETGFLEQVQDCLAAMEMEELQL